VLAALLVLFYILNVKRETIQKTEIGNGIGKTIILYIYYVLGLGSGKFSKDHGHLIIFLSQLQGI